MLLRQHFLFSIRASEIQRLMLRCLKFDWLSAPLSLHIRGQRKPLIIAIDFPEQFMPNKSEVTY